MRGAAGEAQRRKRQALLADIRQRLQSPVSGLVGYSEVLVRDATRQGQAELLPDLDRISQAVRDLLRYE